ncbi:MAG: insulinase family protein [Clostridiales bacterium]|nr:insulinase family protein [Clostridiales bacterium]
MSYISKELKQGINLHCIDTKKFKTNLFTFFITIPLSKNTVTKNALIPAILRQGTANLKTQEEINIKLEELYGATFDCGIDKIGDNLVLKFYMETLNDEYVPTKENLLEQATNLLFDLILNPYIENEGFKEEYLVTEKENMKTLINSKIDNKDRYAFNRCIEEMYKDKPYGLYKYGTIEDLEKIGAKDLYEQYINVINNYKMDIFISGNIEPNSVFELISKNENINKLQDREGKYILNNEQTEIKEETEITTLEEKMDVTQGKLILGLDIFNNELGAKYITKIYNVILGESATSKLFQNVREKASLAYTTRSNYVYQKNNIFIRCGIEIPNYEKAVEIIKEQLEDMKNGNFTDEDLVNAKKYMISGLETLQDEQDSEITYYLGQELSGTLVTFQEYMDKINAVTKEQVEDIAKQIKINTIYFLRN